MTEDPRLCGESSVADAIKPSRGSAIFIILIAISLFAALSFAVSNMMRSGNADMISDQKAGIMADEILDYARNIKGAIQNMRISNGCADTDISFENSVVSGYTNGTNTACQVFHPDGGGMRYMVPNEEWLDTSNNTKDLYGELYFPEGVCVVNVGTDSGANICDDDGDEEIMLVLPWIKKEICLVLNTRSGVTNQNGNPPQDNNLSWDSTEPKFTGSFVGDIELGESAGTAQDLRGKNVGCFEGASAQPQSGGYHFYQVLIAR